MAKNRYQYIDSEVQDLGLSRIRKPQRIAVEKNGMVATQHYLATDAAAKILQKGGNAIDAAVGAAFALGVCEPASSGLGGQTMMLIHLARTRRTFALDGSSRAPSRTSLTTLTEKDRRSGYKATTVPSTPAVLDYAVRNYGTMKLTQVIEPSITYATDGYFITELQHNLSKRLFKHLRSASAGPFFLKNGHRSYRIGEKFRQPVLAETLKRLAEVGIEDFYTGRIARLIHNDMVENDGLIRDDDLAMIPWPIERKPLACHFEGLRVFTFPPPGAGRTLIEMMNIISHFPKKARDFDTPKGALLLANVIQQAFRDRRDRPYEPNFYAQVTQKKMLSVDYAKQIAKRTRKKLYTYGETTHLSVMDKQGNVVALTQSIERIFGAC
ncbi:MAG: gamma-glutamyltransferase family protein, partial [Planctomycetota bacterium]